MFLRIVLKRPEVIRSSWGNAAVKSTTQWWANNHIPRFSYAIQEVDV